MTSKIKNLRIIFFWEKYNLFMRCVLLLDVPNQCRFCFDIFDYFLWGSDNSLKGKFDRIEKCCPFGRKNIHRKVFDRNPLHIIYFHRLKIS